jgi:hypothetical protein
MVKLQLLFYITIFSLLFAECSLAESICIWAEIKYKCDVSWSDKYLTLYRSDKSSFTFYIDAYGKGGKWYETRGMRRSGSFYPASLNGKAGTRFLIQPSGDEIFIIDSKVPPGR